MGKTYAEQAALSMVNRMFQELMYTRPEWRGPAFDPNTFAQSVGKLAAAHAHLYYTYRIPNKTLQRYQQLAYDAAFARWNALLDEHNKRQ